MFNNLLAKIKERYAEQQEEVAKTFAELVDDVVDADRTGLSATIDPDVVAERLQELGKSLDDFDAAVEHVTTYREYAALADAANASPRFASVSLDSPPNAILARTDLHRQCIAELKMMAKLPEAKAKLESVESPLRRKKEEFEAAEKAYIDGAKALSDPITQAKSVVSRCEYAAERYKRILNTPTPRELDLRKQRKELLEPSRLGDNINQTKIQTLVAQIDEQIEAERASRFYVSMSDQYLKTRREYLGLVDAARLPRRIKEVGLTESEEVIRAGTELLRQCNTELRQICKRPDAEGRLRELESQVVQLNKGIFPPGEPIGDPRFPLGRIRQEIAQVKEELARCDAAAERLDRLETLAPAETEFESTNLETDASN